MPNLFLIQVLIHTTCCLASKLRAFLVAPLWCSIHPQPSIFVHGHTNYTLWVGQWMSVVFVLFQSNFQSTTCCSSKWKALPITHVCFSIHAKRKFHSQPLAHVHEHIVYVPLKNLSTWMNICHLWFFCHPSFNPHTPLPIQVASTSNNPLVLFYLFMQRQSFIHNLWFMSINDSTSRWTTDAFSFVFIQNLIHTTCCSYKWKMLPTTQLCYPIHAHTKFHPQPLVHYK